MVLSDEHKSLLHSKLINILPLDNDSITQIIENVSNLSSPGETIRYLKDLLGESKESLDFINEINQLKFKEKKRNGQKTLKLKFDNKNVGTLVKNPPPYSLSSSSSSSSSAKKVMSQNKSSSGITLSQITQPTPKSKSKFSKQSQKRHLESLQDVSNALDDIELTSLLNSSSTEIQGHLNKYSDCNCNGTRHPLLAISPNCLNCGKIICIKHGLVPCRYCKQPLLSKDEINEIINVLKNEKLDMEEKIEGKTKPITYEKNNKTKYQKSKKITFSIKAGLNSSKQQDKIFDKLEKEQKRQNLLKLEKLKQEEFKNEQLKIEKDIEELNKRKLKNENEDKDLIDAKKRLDNLLHFQDDSIQRTKIIDNSSDFDMSLSTSGTSGLNPWSSPLEKALQLKKQQRMLRKVQEAEKARSGRGKHVMSVAIKNGKVVVNQKIVKSEEKIIPDNYSDEEIENEYESDEDEDEDEDSDNFDDEMKKSNENELNDIKELKKKIKQEQKKKYEENIKKFWDYEKDKGKFIKPIFISDNEKKKINEDEEDLNPITLDSKWERVQESDDEDRLVELPSL